MSKDVEEKTTSCYSYEVLMVVQVLASDKDEADKKIDAEGGFVSQRTVTLKDAVTLYRNHGDVE